MKYSTAVIDAAATAYRAAFPVSSFGVTKPDFNEFLAAAYDAAFLAGLGIKFEDFNS